MKSTLDILIAVYEAVQPIMEPLITGKVYVGRSPENDQLENITLNTLTNPGTYLQNGLINVNIEVMEFKQGLPNTARFKELLDTLIPLVDKTDHLGSTGASVQLTIDDDKGIFDSNTQTGKNIYNLRVAFAAL